MSVYVYTYVYVYVYVYVCVSVYVNYVCIYINMCMYNYICIYLYIYIYVCVCLCVRRLGLIDQPKKGHDQPNGIQPLTKPEDLTIFFHQPYWGSTEHGISLPNKMATSRWDSKKNRGNWGKPISTISKETRM